MKRPCLTTTALLAFALGAVVSPASAQDPTPAQVEIAYPLIQAGERLVAAITAAEQQGARLPTVGESPALIRSAFDVDRLERLAGSPVGLIMVSCDKGRTAKMSYFVGGTSRDEAESSDPTLRARAIRAAAENYSRYQDEGALAMRFELRCLGLLTPGFEAYLASPEGVEDRAQTGPMQEGHAGALDTAIILASSPVASDSNADLLSAEILRQTPVLARTITARQRQRLIARIDTLNLEGQPPERKIRFQAIRQALVESGCGPICGG
ncbi:hypothetical protein [Brevundimonas sp. M20]|uniref:hypothetical protein n=1 Tax=Brevundimonas sp. M20 TaxID=2591463 RepID=UPI0011463159|nr:hypothetical protein [Brevundimonas sp. M20]QDH73716.1 hypothetical protein FKQ52_09925 [Brevundimonas sp. M20]